MRCPQHETPRFNKEWIHDAAMHIYDKLLPQQQRLVLRPPSKALIKARRLALGHVTARRCCHLMTPTAILPVGCVQEMLLKYDPDPDCGKWVKLGDRLEWERIVAVPHDLSIILSKAFKAGRFLDC